MIAFRVEVEFGVIGIVGDGAGVPERGVLPGRLPDRKRRRCEPSFHAAPFGLAYDGEMRTNQSELRKRLEQRQSVFRSEQKLAIAGNFNAANHI
jgi:hypothetical protein